MGRRISTIILTAVAVGLSFGTAGAAEHLPRMVDQLSCDALKVVGDYFAETLDEQQAQQTEELAEDFNKDLLDEFERVKEQLNNEYVEKMVNVLTPEQAVTFNQILAADKALLQAIEAADAEYMADLHVLFAIDADDEIGRSRAKTLAARIDALPDDGAGLLLLLSFTDESFAEKYTEVRIQHTWATATIRGQAAKVDWRNARAREEWKKEEKEQLDAENEKFMKQATDLMTEEQKQLFDKAVKAKEKWQTAKQTAIEEYDATVGKVVGGEKKREIERHRRDLLRLNGRVPPMFW